VNFVLQATNAQGLGTRLQLGPQYQTTRLPRYIELFQCIFISTGWSLGLISPSRSQGGAGRDTHLPRRHCLLPWRYSPSCLSLFLMRCRAASYSTWCVKT